jgi:hypothetical protein
MDRKVRDARPLGRWVIRATWASTALFAVQSVADLGGVLDENSMTDSTAIAVVLFAAVLIVVVFATFVIALRWVYLVSDGAYILSNGETTKPGWAVGWYFVPFANLVKPYQAMREAWQVSRNPANWHEVDTDYLPAWWGLWIVFNVLSNAAGRLPPESGLTTAFDLASTLLAVPLAWLFTRLVRDISEAQSGNHVAEVFA